MCRKESLKESKSSGGTLCWRVLSVVVVDFAYKVPFDSSVPLRKTVLLCDHKHDRTEGVKIYVDFY